MCVKSACDLLYKHLFCVSTHIFLCTTFQLYLLSAAGTPSIYYYSDQTDTHKCYILCVCVTALLLLPTLTSVTSSSNTNNIVRIENISARISVLPNSNAISDTYPINTHLFQALLNLKQQYILILKTQYFITVVFFA